jgi:hypothetical protein
VKLISRIAVIILLLAASFVKAQEITSEMRFVDADGSHYISVTAPSTVTANRTCVLADADECFGGGAPADAKYLVGAANGTLSDEINVGVADNTTIVANGTTWEAKTLPDCDNATTSKLLFDQGTNAFSCGTDQTGSATPGGSDGNVQIKSGSGFAAFGGSSCPGGEFANAISASGGLTCDTPAGGGSLKYRQTWTANQSIPYGSSGSASLDTRNGHPILRFEDAVDTCIHFYGKLRGYGGGGLTVALEWMAQSATSGTVGWVTLFERHDTGHDLDSGGFAAGNTSSATTNATAGAPTYTTIAHTDGAQIDSVANGESYRLQVCRDGDGSAVTDSMTNRAELKSVEVYEP